MTIIKALSRCTLKQECVQVFLSPTRRWPRLELRVTVRFSGTSAQSVLRTTMHANFKSWPRLASAWSFSRLSS
eukprot:923485-Rhodomonas_salina.5